MRDEEGMRFLQWCLPRLQLRRPGFRKVRRQVYKRVDRRIRELGLSDLASYREYLSAHPAQWRVLDALCRITISRFHRDKGVFQFLEQEVLPHLASLVLSQGEEEFRCWSLGCAAGEEPYTLSILWQESLAPRFSSLRMRIVGTDIDRQALERAKKACYSASSVKDLPPEWRARAFLPSPDGFCLREQYRKPVVFLEQDIRITCPTMRFHLILCRNLVFTYFDQALQQRTLQAILGRLLPHGALVIGKTESLPNGSQMLVSWDSRYGVYRKREESY